MAKYCELKCFYHGTPPAGWSKEYSAPMIGDNTLYFQVPMDASSVTILPASAEGYESISECYEVIEDKLGYTPDVAVEMPYINTAGFDDDEYMMYLRNIAPNYASRGYVTYTPGYAYYAPTASSDYDVGGIQMGGVPMMCASFMYYNGSHSRAGDNQAYWVTQSGIQRLEWYFTIFPYDLFRSGKFDFDSLLDSVSHPGDQDWKRYCNIRFQVWQYPEDYYDADLAGKWNCFISQEGHDMNIQVLRDNYQGKETTAYDSGKPMAKPTDQGNPPGSGGRPGDPINIPDLPGSDMTSAGSLRIYSMTAADIKSLFDYLHANDPGTSIMKWWQNPIQGIISLHYLPYAMKIGSAEEIKVLGLSTGVTAYAASQFQTIHFGYRDLELDSGTYLDYSPYTKVSIYLPGIGIRELNVDDLMNKRIWVVYHCDNVTGQFAAYIAVAKKGEPESKASVKYTFSGQVAASFPLSQENWGNTYIAGATLAAGALATGVVAAGAGAAAGGGAAAGAAEGTAAGAAETGISASGVAGGAVSVGNSLSNLAKPTVSRSGSVTGTTSLFAVKRPYLIIESPSYYSFEGFDSTKGYPYGLYTSFKNLKGFAVIEAVHLTGIPATVTELNEIETLLKSGVHF